MGRRILAGLGLSLALHLGMVAGAIGFALYRGLPAAGAIDVEITGVKLDDIKELPLGPAPVVSGGETAGVTAVEAPRPKRRKPKSVASNRKTGDEEAAAAAAARAAQPDAGTGTGPSGAPKPGDLHDWGPEDSRVTVLMRLDRLRATPYVGAVDELLSALPDRTGLLDGTGLDLYRDFDALLIATPNPLDYAATLLTLRHHLSDQAMRAAIDKGAAAAGRRIVWRTEGGRPVGERKPIDRSASDRDDRLVLLPAPGLVVVAPPVYAKILLGKKPPPAAQPDGGDASADGGAASGEPKVDWTDLIARIDGQDSAVPDDAVVMLSLFGVFTVRTGDAGGGAASAPGAPPGAAGRSSPLFFDMPLPQALTLTMGAAPTPFVDLRAEYALDAEAARCQTAWPDVHARMKANPWLVLGGFGPIVDRIEVSRQGRILHARDTASEAETRHVLGVIAAFVHDRRAR